MKNYIPRVIYKAQISQCIGKEIIKVIIGQRRVGKSYLLFQTMEREFRNLLEIKDNFPK